MFKQGKPVLLVLISFIAVIAAFYAEHCAVKSYRLTGNLAGIENIESGLTDYAASKQDAQVRMIALYKIREGLTLLSVMSKHHSFIEHVFDCKFPIAHPNNNIHEDLYDQTNLNLKDMIAVLKKVQQTSYEKRVLQLLEFLDKNSQ